MLPKNKENRADSALNKGSIVLYEHNGTPLLGLIQATSKSKFLILNQRAREVQLAANRLRKIPGSIPSDISGTENIAKYLEELDTKNKEKVTSKTLEELWNFVAEEERDYEISELCDLYFGNNSTDNFLALTYTLLKDGIFFKRVKDLYRPRPLNTIEELKKAEAARQEKINLQKRMIEQFIVRKKDPKLVLDESFNPFISLLESIAAQAPHLDNNKQKDVKEILGDLQDALGIEIRGNRHDQAYRVLREVNLVNRRTNPAKLRHRPIVEFEEDTKNAALEIKKQFS